MDTSFPYYTMEIHGEGTITAAPDMAVIYLGAETNQMDLQAAQSENAKIINQVIRALRDLGIPEKDIQTSTYTINKRYDYVEGKQIDRGYVVTHILKITLKEIKLTGEVVDQAVAAGANVVQNITFQMENPSKHYQEALILALADATKKAETLARQMHTKLFIIPLKIVEQTTAPIPYGAPSFAIERNATPIQPGQLQITAQLLVLFSYDPT